MHCMDCGNKLETVNYVESCTKYFCGECNVHWFQSRVIRVEWSKKHIPLESDNGGVYAPATSTKKCCECGETVDTTKTYGVNEPYYFCSNCMNDDF